MAAVNWVYVGGTFDFLHPGHLKLLRRAHDAGPVVVALNTDEFAERYKRKPIMTFDERFEQLIACLYADHVVPNVGDEDSKVTIDALALKGFHVSHVVHGDDWKGEALLTQMGFTQQWLSERGIEMLYLPYTEGVSSTEIEQRVKSR